MTSDDVGDLFTVLQLEGRSMVVNSRIMRVDQSSLLKDALVSSEDDVHLILPGSDAGSRDTMQDQKMTSNFTY